MAKFRIDLHFYPIYFPALVQEFNGLENLASFIIVNNADGGVSITFFWSDDLPRFKMLTMVFMIGSWTREYIHAGKYGFTTQSRFWPANDITPKTTENEGS